MYKTSCPNPVLPTQVLNTDAGLGILQHVEPLTAQLNFLTNGVIFGGKVNLPGGAEWRASSDDHGGSECGGPLSRPPMAAVRWHWYGRLLGAGERDRTLVRSPMSGTGGQSNQCHRRMGRQVGLRYLIRPQVGVFGEWKFMTTTAHFDQVRSLSNLEVSYVTHVLVAGLSYHFR